MGINGIRAGEVTGAESDNFSVIPEAPTPFPRWGESRTRYADTSIIGTEIGTHQMLKGQVNKVRQLNVMRKVMDRLGPLVSSFLVSPEYNRTPLSEQSIENRDGLTGNELDEEILRALYRTPGVARHMNRQSRGQSSQRPL